MTTKDDLKKVMKEIKAEMKAHRDLHKASGKKEKELNAGEVALIDASRERLRLLLQREEKIVRELHGDAARNGKSKKTTRKK